VNQNTDLHLRSSRTLVPNYRPQPITIVRGEGCTVWDADGRSYLDLMGGIATTALGHCHPKVVAALAAQSQALWHITNLYSSEPQIVLAEKLVAHSFAERVFFCNSGAEANEAALKIARRHHYLKDTGRFEIVAFDGSFHGRTLFTVTATGQPSYREGFEPVVPGILHAPFGDLAATEAIIGEKTAAILVEPLQGEGGVRPLAKEYLQGIRALCDKHGLLLIFDEIQTGIGRTGTLFAYEQLGVQPDILTMAKALGNGLPLGAMMTTSEIAAALAPGTHGTTFGGNPVACAGAVATMEVMLADGFLDGVRQKGAYFQAELQKLVGKFPKMVAGVRGMGLIVGAVLTEQGVEHGGEIVNKMFDRGYLMNFAGNTAFRFLPPLIVTEDDIDSMIGALAEVLAEY
jgi:acetylornithine/N-succinyldiaminopimelate aminotransferase